VKEEPAWIQKAKAILDEGRHLTVAEMEEFRDCVWRAYRAGEPLDRDLLTTLVGEMDQRARDAVHAEARRRGLVDHVKKGRSDA
jgi:hypothetical protein